ncbi:MAG: hypothetical protein HKN48_01890 [Flavobacteriaceae bacterium]|nr:hypothetical protein [Flavobacteriaceae bacterium]
MKDKKEILLLVPDGTGIKNYLFSNVFKDSWAFLSIFHNFDEETLGHIGSHLKIENSIEIPEYREGVKEKFLRELIHLTRLKFNVRSQNNPTILAFRKRSHKSKKLKLFHAFVSFCSIFYRTYSSILRLEKKYDAAIRQTQFYQNVVEILSGAKPDIIFCTHQRALKAPPIFAAACDLGITTTTVIYSWDNLPKARLALKADTYFVWSRHMKSELSKFYPEITEEQIKVTGTPQFEFYYQEENVIPKSEFFSKYELDPGKKLICFSGDDIKTSPYDPHYLNDIAEGLQQAGMHDSYQIIFRRCPADISERYDWVLKKFPDLIVDIPPLWNFNRDIWTAVYPLYEDIKLLVSLAKYCDVVINLGSTMAFDFGMFHKPCIYINYDTIPDKNWSVKTVYNYQHFRTMPSKKAVYWLNKKEDISAVIKNSIEEPHTEIRDWFEVVVNHEQSASLKIIKELLE